MVEEFHGNGLSGNAWKGKLLYGWNTLNTNVWLPSLAELIGTTGTQYDLTGCYLSVMQGLNISAQYWTDAKGGNQFTYFKQYNASGGGEEIWRTCNQEQTHLRTPDPGQTQNTWIVISGSIFSGAQPVTEAAAVHPSV